jgi:hypothetical protein
METPIHYRTTQSWSNAMAHGKVMSIDLRNQNELYYLPNNSIGKESPQV